MSRIWGPLSLCAILALFTAAGCQKGQPDKAPDAAPKAADGEHPHKPGKHGGAIVEIGRDNYHAEAVFGDKGQVTLYLLGKDEAVVHEVESQALEASAKAQGELQGVPLTLTPQPRGDDSKGKTSVFVGTLPEALRDKRVEVTVPTIRIDGARFRFSFRNYTEGGHTAMPKAVPSEKARQLYLTPGGKYTDADIKANGGLTARQKYGDEMAEHEDPKKGDRICPVSKSKANPKFTWVVGGKTYSFCCTPCIDDFVKKAKASPEQIKAPEEYVQK